MCANKVAPAQPIAISSNATAFIGMQFFLLVALALVALMFIMHYFRPEPTYFIKDLNNNKLLVTTESKPNVSADGLVKWATLVATKMHTTDFFNYDKILSDLQADFTASGYKSLLAAFEQTNRRQDIIGKQIIVSCVAVDTGVVLAESPGEWVVQVPLLLTFQGASEGNTISYITSTLFIKEVPTNKAVKGIGVNKVLDVAALAGLGA